MGAPKVGTGGATRVLGSGIPLIAGGGGPCLRSSGLRYGLCRSYPRRWLKLPPPRPPLCGPPPRREIARLVCEYGFFAFMERAEAEEIPLLLGPAPISMSGSSTIMPVAICLPPVPPYSAVSNHLRSASVRTLMGISLVPSV